MAQARAGTIALLVLSLPTLIGVVLYGPFALDLLIHRRTPSRFLIPPGFQGWIQVEYGVRSAPPLEQEGKYRVLKLRSDGTLATSSHLPDGWGRDEFFYAAGFSRQRLSNAGWCKGGMIWGETLSGDGQSQQTQKFFVGNEDQYRLAIDPTGKTFSPCG